MKARACVPILLIPFVAPALLTEAGLTALPLAERQAHAQESDPVTEVARQRYEEGVKAFDTGRFEDARAAFLQAYALKRHPAVLLNLGLSELRSNHPEDAGNHLQQFLREHKAATPDQRAAAEKGIAEAKRRTGFIIVIADANGADISVDGSLVGKAPLLDPIFVAPGKHTLFATYQGKSATTQVDAKMGSAAAATLTLGIPGAPIAPAPAPAVPAIPSPSPAPTPVQPMAPVPMPAQPPSAPAQPPSAAAAPGAPQLPPPVASGFTFSTGTVGALGPDQATSGREPLFQWYKRKPIAWVGTGVAGVGLVLGVVGSSMAGSASSNAEAIAERIREHAADPNVLSETPDLAGRTNNPCGPREGGSDVTGFEKACSQLRDELDTFDTGLPLAITGWVVFGVGVAGTVTYALLDWYPSKSKAAWNGPRVTAIAPVIAPDRAGLGIAGIF